MLYRGTFMNLLDITNQLIDILEIGNYLGKKRLSIKSFGLGDSAINFINENKIKYQDLINQAFNDDKDILNTFTFKKFESIFISYFADKFKNKQSATKEDVAEFKKLLKDQDIKIFHVLRDLHGITLNNPQQPCVLGGYTIYKFSNHRKTIEAKTKLDPKYIWHNSEPEYLIEWQSEARHFEKAIELADEQFSKFELILRYVIGNPSERIEVGVLNYQGWRHRRAFVFSSEGDTSISATGHGPTEPIPLDDPYFISSYIGNDIVWNLVGNNNTNKLQKRIILAIEWVGLAMSALSPQSAFLKAAIAIEIIFTYSEKTIITPSILNQISESIALILGKTAVERIKIERNVKKLYSTRSAIVHSGKNDLAEYDFGDMLRLARDVIITLLTNEKLKDITSIENLYTFLKKLKYSSNAI